MSAYTAQQAEAALKPRFDKYIAAFDNLKWDEVEKFFHPNAVLVVKDKESVYGSKDITAYSSKFGEISGKSATTFSNLKYEGTGDYLIVSGSMSSETEKIGTIKAKFIQIWKKEGDRHLVYHDEFEVIA